MLLEGKYILLILISAEVRIKEEKFRMLKRRKIYGAMPQAEPGRRKYFYADKRGFGGTERGVPEQ